MGRKRPTPQSLIRANCPSCQEVWFEPASAKLLLRNSGHGNHLLFKCPKCSGVVGLEGLGKELTSLVLAAGVRVIDQTVECLSYPGRPPLTEDDLLTFMTKIMHVSYLAAHARRQIAAHHRHVLNTD